MPEDCSMEIEDKYAREASIRPKEGMVNLGLDSFSKMKWLFYIANYLVLTRSQKLLLLSKFNIAVNQHQRFTQNMLSFYQCLGL